MAAPLRKLAPAVNAVDEPIKPAPKEPPANKELAPPAVAALKAPAAAPIPKYPKPCQKFFTLP